MENQHNRLDWPFTPYDNSSENFATFNRSGHYTLIIVRSPIFGSNTSNYTKLYALTRQLVAFAKAFTWLLPLSCWPIIQKVHSCYIITSAAYKITSSFRFVRAYCSYLMHFPSQYYALLLFVEYLALEDGSPIFRQNILRRTLFWIYLRYILMFK